MNPLLQSLHPYPFERLQALFAAVKPDPAKSPIKFHIGEPRHATPQLVIDALTQGAKATLANYPMTAGSPALREAIARWLIARHDLDQLDATTQVLPVLGSREALFAFAQTVLDPTQPDATVLIPNPFYQIYEGAAILGGAAPYFVNADPARGYAHAWDEVPEEVLDRTQLLYVCSPDNPTGHVLDLAAWQRLFALADRHGFVIASDECYSEIYFDENAPPLGALGAARKLGRRDYANVVVFGSLSKRSNAPGLRSGYVAGNAELLKAFWLYRTYHGSAMSGSVAQASIAAWSDEAHVRDNRARYARKFRMAHPRLAEVMPCEMPQAAFYLWARTPIDDAQFAQRLYEEQNVTVLPGRYLARDAHGQNPGRNRVRIALVAEFDECAEGIERIVTFAGRLRN
ncbi:MAG TPA: succinyldiaminopimelate transaminase [Casimicrobiaceae bacterium]|nr:succinyldiaminopimelate transaminase [Casimicrobiaceae bacterium]